MNLYVYKKKSPSGEKDRNHQFVLLLSRGKCRRNTWDTYCTNRFRVPSWNCEINNKMGNAINSSTLEKFEEANEWLDDIQKQRTLDVSRKVNHSQFIQVPLVASTLIFVILHFILYFFASMYKEISQKLL